MIKKTANDKILAKVSDPRPKVTGAYIIYGHAIDPDTQVPIDGCKRHQIRTSNDTYDADVQYLIARIEADFQNQQPRSYVPTEKRGLFLDALAHVTEPNDLCPASWSESTKSGTLSYFSRQILPRMDVYGANICNEDMVSIYTELVEKAIKSGRSNKDVRTAQESVSSYFSRCAKIYRNMRFLFPELPDIEFPAAEQNTANPEQAKALPDSVRVKFASLLLRLPSHGCVLGAVLMLTAGLRTSEAAAPTIGDIEHRGDFGVLPVITQRPNLEEVSRLKTPAAYRVVVLPKLAMDILDIRINHLTGLGYCMDEIRKMPCVARNDDPHLPVRSQELSRFVRKMLELCGCSEDYFENADVLQRIEPDIIDANNKISDVSAYILRRDWATRASNICGITANVVNYLIGHKNDGAQIKDYLTPEAQRDIAYKLERYVFLPSHSCNPAFVPYQADSIREHNIEGNCAHVIRADRDAHLTLNLRSLEADDTLTITVPEGRKVSVSRADVSDSVESRAVRPIMGGIHSQSYYDLLQSEANGISIETLLEG